jgi:VanZ family protein
MVLIFAGSTDALSASNSGLVLRPALLWLFPHITDPQLAALHFFLRKLGHLTEYAILALLAARAFYGSANERLRLKWFAASLVLIMVYAFSDEIHQSFEPSRTASVYDSLIDIAGGVSALLVMHWWRRRHRLGGAQAEARP